MIGIGFYPTLTPATSSQRNRFHLVSIARSKPTAFLGGQLEAILYENEGMAAYRHSGHAMCDIKYHLVGITKYRYKIWRGEVAERARDPIRQIGHAREVVIVRGSVSPDPIHMLVSAPAHMAPSKLVQYVKGRSSRRLQEEFPSLRKRYWGQHLWARGYFCATVGAVDEETIKAYIENQKGDQDDQGFKIAAPTEP